MMLNRHHLHTELTADLSYLFFPISFSPAACPRRLRSIQNQPPPLLLPPSLWALSVWAN